MCKKSLQKVQKMNGEAFVSEARGWADKLVMRNYEGPGEMERAIDKTSQQTGISYKTLWSLRYRPPKDLAVSVYFHIKAAYEAEVQRQKRLYQHERKMSDAINRNVVRTADFMAGEKGKGT